MISLTCTSCKRVLEIDDAFAGGVCRCQHCGTIQTVPSSLKNSANAAGTGAKTLYQRQSRGGSGASTVAEAPSGLSSSLPAAEPAPPRAPKVALLPLAIGAIALLLVIITFIFWAIA